MFLRGLELDKDLITVSVQEFNTQGFKRIKNFQILITNKPGEMCIQEGLALLEYL